MNVHLSYYIQGKKASVRIFNPVTDDGRKITNAVFADFISRFRSHRASLPRLSPAPMRGLLPTTPRSLDYDPVPPALFCLIKQSVYPAEQNVRRFVRVRLQRRDSKTGGYPNDLILYADLQIFQVALQSFG
jgi:hypothetical protein